MFLDMESAIVELSNKDGSCKGRLYVDSLSYALYLSPFRGIINNISAHPDEGGLAIEMKINKTGASKKFIVPGLSIMKSYSNSINGLVSDEIDDIVKETTSLKFLARDASNLYTSKHLVKHSSFQHAEKDFTCNLHPGVHSWYFSDFVELPFMDFDDSSKGQYYYYIDSPIGPLSCLSFGIDSFNANNTLTNIHFVATSTPMRRTGMASALYEALASFCIDISSILTRGEPSIDTCREGYYRRARWLVMKFPDIAIVNYSDRHIIDLILEESPHLLYSPEPALIESILSITQHYVKISGCYEIGVFRSLAAMSCMSSDDIKKWSD